MSWHCKCGLLNNGLNESCAALLTDKHLEHYQISPNTLDRLRIVVANGANNVTDKEELFKKYYNKGVMLVKDMDDTQLREHREGAQQIAEEAKAIVLAADDQIRERGARKKAKDKEWLVSTDSAEVVSDAINAVKSRAARMSKMDKARKSLLDLGMDEDIVKEMIRNMERGATDKTLKTITFPKAVTETGVVTVKSETKSDSEPFDFSKVSFNK